ncbi:MAG: hypothetical protein FWD23_18845, partial [Oscillospiraceae bacterium]|nr:hypothetical protein [Oscillospiraceae bacterium]
FFDKIKNQAAEAVNKADGQAVNNIGRNGNKSVPVVFSAMPETLEEFIALPQAEMSTPFDTAALCIAAFCVYPLNKDIAVAMLNYLKGPKPLGTPEIQFLAQRMEQNKKAGFLGASYFDGATPQNDYTPTEPYTVTISENLYSYSNEGYASLYIKSGGADSPRPVSMRQAKDGKWYLWEYPGLLTDILSPESANPWAHREFI